MLAPDEYDTSMRQVWSDIPGSSRLRGHPAPFPAALAERIIRMSSYIGDTVLDPFLGTGSTTDAAIAAGRNSIGYEIAEQYWLASQKRFAQLFLGNAVLFERDVVQ